MLTYVGTIFVWLMIVLGYGLLLALFAKDTSKKALKGWLSFFVSLVAQAGTYYLGVIVFGLAPFDAAIVNITLSCLVAGVVIANKE